MYNYQTYLRQNLIQEKCDKIKKDYQQSNKFKQKKIPSMIQSHKKRIQGFILAMVEKPLHIQQYKEVLYDPRSPLKKNNHLISKLGHTNKTFYMNHHLQKTRLQEIQKQNDFYDAVPFKNSSNHQFRQNSISNITKPFKLKPCSSSLRIKEELERKTLNCLSYSKNTKVQNFLKPQSTINHKSLTKLINKSLLPLLHQKTHFQSVKTIYSQSPCGFLKSNINNGGNLNLINEKQVQHDQQYVQDDSSIDGRKQQQKGSNDYMNRKQNSKQALVKCGLLKMIKKNNENVSLIDKSRLFSNSFSTVNMKIR